MNRARDGGERRTPHPPQPSQRLRLRPGDWLALASGPLAYLITQRVRPSWVEQHYSLALGQPVASALGDLNGLVGFSVVEAIIWASVGIGGLSMLVHVTQPDRWRWLGWTLLRGVVGASAAYAIFVLAWGLNYHREPIIGRFGFPAGAPTAAELKALAAEQITALNALREEVSEDAGGVATLPPLNSAVRVSRAARTAEVPAPATQPALRDVLVRVDTAYKRAAVHLPFLGGDYCLAKPVFASVLLSYAGLGGVYCPFTGEPNVNADALPITLPFSIAHETAHQRGIAREDEANFVAWIVMRDFGDPDMRYSALLEGAFYVIHAYRDLDPDGARELWGRRSDPVERDRFAEAAWRDRYTTPLAAITASVNSAYLKSNGVHDGVESYGRLVDLMVAERRTRK